MTIFLIASTALISVICFSNRNLFEKLQFNPYRVYHNKEYYRLVTHAFLHANWVHLFINMFVLYQFGRLLEDFFKGYNNILHLPPVLVYIFLYFSSIVISALTTLKKYRDIFAYNAVGASGAVSSVLFACILFDPWMKLGVFLVIPMPGIIFGILYLWYSNYMSNRSGDNVNHDAHFLGALYGLTYPVLLNPNLFYEFVKQLVHFHL
jgi:membrane associated rhomboid family serine protease